MADFAERLRQAIAAKGLPLAQVAEELARAGAPCGVSTLSNWQSGRSRPERPATLRAVDELERLLDLQPGELRSALPPRAPRGRRSSVVASGAAPVSGPTHSWAGPPALVALLKRLDATTDDLVGPVNQPISRRLHLTIDRHGVLVSLSMATVVRATRDGTGRIIDAGYDENDGAAPRIVAARGARVGRFAHDRHGLLSAYELLLPRPLAAGEAALLEYTEYFAEDATVEEISLRAADATRDLAVRVEFDRRRLPARVRAFRRDGDDVENPLEAPLTVGDRATVQLVVTDPHPGFHGIAWEWE